MNEITYSLKLGNENSEEYYRTIGNFADEVMQYAGNSVIPLIKNYIDYVKEYKLETERKTGEYVLELLSFGILWKTYAHIALSVKFAPYITLIYFGEWRKKHQRMKPVIDFLRGAFITMFLLPKKINTDYAKPTLLNMDKACLWFEATNEFREHALRFIKWRAYWQTLPEADQQKIFQTIASFREWFEKRSTEVLGKYTEKVNSFLEEKKEFYRWREDRISCTRSRMEYHLNMIGAELLNRAYKSDYSATELTAVLLPGCMRALPDDKCKAKKLPKGMKCAGCVPNCRVNKLRLEGLENNYEVYVIPHASDLSLWSPKKGEPRCGVVASACVTTLVEGGLELKRYGVPAQCVLLDYSGCKKHWHPQGKVTSLNGCELERALTKSI